MFLKLHKQQFNAAICMVIFLLIFLQQLGHLKAANLLFRNMNFTDVRVQFNPKYMSNLTSWIDSGGISFEMTTVRQITNGMRGSIEIQIKLQNSNKYQTLFAYEIDACRMLQNVSKKSLLHDWFRLVLKHGNLMESCPAEAGNYYLRNMKFKADSIPVYLQKGNYRVNLHNFYGKKNSKTEELVCHFSVDLLIY